MGQGVRPAIASIVGTAAVLAAMAAGAYVIWSPGADLRDGSHDLARNGLWIGHGWLGDDGWFQRNDKIEKCDHFRSPEAIAALYTTLRGHHITDVYPHLCPANRDGTLPGVDSAQAHRLLDGLPGIRILPWIGGIDGRTVRLHDPAWRASFARSAAELIERYPFAGIHLNIEPCPSGDEEFLTLLDELRAALPKGALISVAAYPPPTILHPFRNVHWGEDYYRKVSMRSDQMAVMMYDTALRSEKLYIHLMRRWTRDTLAWSSSKELLLGLPTYEDAGARYHVPRVENLRNALLGIHAGLLDLGTLPAHYQGVAIYCLWETDDDEWRYFEDHFLKK